MSGSSSTVLTGEEKETAHSDVSAEKPVRLPPLPQPQSVGSASRVSRNPFKMPPEHELFVLREKERQKLKEERARERKLHVHEKTTYTSRMNTKMSSLRRAVGSPDSTDPEFSDISKASRLHEDTQYILATTRELPAADRRIEKEDLNSYLGKKREMFLMQYSLGVKRDEIKKLEDIARAEEKKLEAAEKYLEQSASMFDEFLKENDKNSVEAIKMAEVATKAKLEKVAEIKRLNNQVMAIKSDISRNEEQLNELKTYRQFLFVLAPQEWREKQQRQQQQQRNEPTIEVSGEEACAKNEEALYFTAPQQLLDIFTELEEQNLSLIQNSQETEETLDEVRHTQQMTEKKMNQEVEVLKGQVEVLERCIIKEKEKADDLETKAKLFSFGEFKAEDQEDMLQQLDKKVAEVYTKLIGSCESTVSTLHMLTAIEGKMEELFEELESLPPDKVETAEKNKEKERRIRQREQKMEEQRKHQEERLKRALERAQADTKKKVGRKLMYRSDPPVFKKKQHGNQDQKEKEEEELLYFFS